MKVKKIKKILRAMRDFCDTKSMCTKCELAEIKGDCPCDNLPHNESELDKLATALALYINK